MSTWSVFKFGGASVKDADALRNAIRVVREHGRSPLVVVVSAMGKTTNA
ncbi:MAG: aspartate kinase, partial [Cryomorphaceae bacterium]|nr:aspartate kinase [Cryomorphaceae bacterium]